jgi:hypothetical protein
MRESVGPGAGEAPGKEGTVNEPDAPMAHVMASMPGVWRRLLIAHVADRLGRCMSCRTASGSGERWPCSLHQIATEAKRLYGLQLGQAVGGE